MIAQGFGNIPSNHSIHCLNDAYVALEDVIILVT